MLELIKTILSNPSNIPLLADDQTCKFKITSIYKELIRLHSIAFSWMCTLKGNLYYIDTIKSFSASKIISSL